VYGFNKSRKGMILYFHIFCTFIYVANMAYISFGRNGYAESSEEREVTGIPRSMFQNGACVSVWNKSTNIHVNINGTRHFSW
jgi:hypothetical protein